MNKRNRILAAILAVFLAILISVNLLTPGLIATTGDPGEEAGQETTVERSIEEIPGAQVSEEPGAEVSAEQDTEAAQQPDVQEPAPETTDKAGNTLEEKKDAVDETAAEKKDEATVETKETEDKEAVAQILNYEDDNVIVNVSEVTAGAIPENASLKVVPLVKGDEKTDGQYRETEAKLQEKAETEEYDIAGFLAYDITFVDADGNKVEPNGDVKVTLDYKQAVAPEGIQEIAPDTDVTVMHLEEDAQGTVKEVVDMNESQQVKVLDTTQDKEIKKAEFETSSFSVYTLTWKYGQNNKNTRTVRFHYVDTSGFAISGRTGNDETSGNKTININTSEYQIGIPGYTYSYTTVNSFKNSARVSSIKGDSSSMYYNGSTQWSVSGSVYNVYFVYEKDGNPGGSGPILPDPLGDPEHHKTIKQNGTNENGIDDYTISLDVIGKRTNPAPIDILLIVDFSGSMKKNLGNENDATASQSRIGKVSNAIKLLKEQLQGVSEMTTVRFAMVEFNGPTSAGNSETASQNSRNNGSGDASTYRGWTEYNSFNVPTASEMYNLCVGGTNWQAGIRQGNNVMASANPNANQYVIFLTDGAPTFRYGTANTDAAGDITSVNLNGSTRTYGTGNSDDNGHNFAAAREEYTASQYLQNVTARYLINASTQDNDCTKFAQHIGAAGGVLSGSNDTALNASFKAIADSIGVAQAYTDVVIEDKLSEYVKFSSESPSASDIRVYAGNTLLSADKYTVDMNKLSNGIVSVKILNGSALENGVTYRVEFNVIPSEKAITGPYDQVPYSGTGDAGTDHSSNNPKFSEGKSGYWSNDNENTKLIYTDTGKPGEKPYQKPVFQVQTTTYSVEKVWKGPTDTDLESMKVDVKLTAKAVTDKGTVDLVGTGYLNESKISLDKAGNWKHTWENLPKYYYYYNNNGKAQHVKIQYGVKEVDGSGAAIDEGGRLTLNNKDYVVTYEESDGKTIITNTGVLNTLSILKVDSADTKIKLQGAEFKLEKKNANGAWESVKKADGSDYTVTTLENGMAVFEELGNGTYRIIEIKAPSGYTILKQPFEITLPYAQSNPADENISVDGNHKVTVTIKNSKIYALPESGGIGTYLFTISGVSILMTAFLLFIMNKRKEKGEVQKL
ncbi:MAG: SpaA isopeptide-forming pilin-related protein [Muricomes sp.]